MLLIVDAQNNPATPDKAAQQSESPTVTWKQVQQLRGSKALVDSFLESSSRQVSLWSPQCDKCSCCYCCLCSARGEKEFESSREDYSATERPKDEATTAWIRLWTDAFHVISLIPHKPMLPPKCNIQHCFSSCLFFWTSKQNTLA